MALNKSHSGEGASEDNPRAPTSQSISKIGEVEFFEERLEPEMGLSSQPPELAGVRFAPSVPYYRSIPPYHVDLRGAPSDPYGACELNIGTPKEPTPVFEFSQIPYGGTVSNVTVIDEIQQLRRELQEHDERATSEHAIMSQELSNLQQVNQGMSELLSKKYPAKTLTSVVLLSALGMIGSLVLWYFLDVVLVHPLLALIILIPSLGLGVLGFLRTRE